MMHYNFKQDIIKDDQKHEQNNDQISETMHVKQWSIKILQINNKSIKIIIKSYIKT